MSSTTLVYKRLDSEEDVNLDLYPPTSIRPSALVPAVVYFHGGGLTVGNRKSWFPAWLHKRVTAAGYAFISADYQLMPPATGREILHDIQDLWDFVTSDREMVFSLSAAAEDNAVSSASQSPLKFKIDTEAIAVAGSSAGGLCAYLAAMHCISPKPKAVVSLYGMGGDFLIPHYLSQKTQPFFLGREMIDPQDFRPYLHSIHLPQDSPEAYVPYPQSIPRIVDSPLKYHPDTYHIPGYPANPRMFLPRLYLQLGVFLDYYTGLYEDRGLSARLRKALGFDKTPIAQSHNGDTTEKLVVSPRAAQLTNDDYLRSLIPSSCLCLFPQFGVTGKWPPMMLVHGTHDSAVPFEESRALTRKLEASGVDVQLCEIDGREHSFDYEPGAEEIYGSIFDEVMTFLNGHLGSTGGGERCQ